MIGRLDLDEDRDAEADRFGIEDRDAPLDHARRLELLDPPPAGRLRQIHPAATSATGSEESSWRMARILRSVRSMAAIMAELAGSSNMLVARRQHSEQNLLNLLPSGSA